MAYSPDGYGFVPDNNGNNMNYGSNGYYGQQLKQPAFIPKPLWAREKMYLKKLSILGGGSIILYIFLSGLFVAGFQGISSIIDSIGGSAAGVFYRVTETSEFQYLFEVFYSIFIVGGPFFLLGLIFRRKGLAGNIPMGKPRHAGCLPLVVLAGFGLCLAGNIVTVYLDMFIEILTGFELTNLEMPETPKSAVGVFLFFLSTAVVPALIEEMALRGIIMQPLRRYGDWFAIICSSVIFGFMHCNLVQIPFAMIAGIVIGYAVIITESVWTGVLIHFMNNGFSVLSSVIADFYGVESLQYRVCSIAMYLIMAIGILCSFIVYKKYSDKPIQKSPLINSGKNFAYEPHPMSAKISNKTLFASYALTVSMIAAFVFVCYETVIVFMYTQ